MNGERPKAIGEIRATVSDDIVRLQAEYYGKGPTKAKTYEQMAESFTSIVEQATGRKVRAFLSETDIEHDVSVETFLLAGDRTDMTGFENG